MTHRQDLYTALVAERIGFSAQPSKGDPFASLRVTLAEHDFELSQHRKRIRALRWLVAWLAFTIVLFSGIVVLDILVSWLKSLGGAR
jgi:hypothetical protein